MSTNSKSTSTSLSLKEYLKKYQNPEDEDSKKKKKKKKKSSRDLKSDAVGGVCVVDEDPIWQKPFSFDQQDELDNESPDEKPLVEEDVEVKRMKRLEAIRAQRPYLAISEDGSGWVSVSDGSKQAHSGNEFSDVLQLQQKKAPFENLSPEAKPLANELEDLSPPRQQHQRYDLQSPEVNPNLENSLNSDRDFSPPRRSRPQINSFDNKVKRPDMSPLRQQRRRYYSPSPKPSPNTTKPDSDLSPPRHSRYQLDSFDHRTKNSDSSPPRRRRRRHYDSPSPEPNHMSANSLNPDPDLSPPRLARPQLDSSARRTSNFERSGSPDRSSHRNSDVSLDMESASATDLSPPRHSQHRAEFSSSFSDKRTVERVDSPDPSTLLRNKKDLSSAKAGRSAGLFTTQEIREDIERRKKEDLKMMKQMHPSVSGRNAEVVYRHQGKRISKEEFLKLRHGEEKPQEIKLEWGKGLAQRKEAEARELELELEKDKPFARTRDDPELDNMLKERIRWGDPMAHLVKRKNPELVLKDFGEDDKMKESGFIIPQTIPNHSWIKRGIDAPPNRYGIRPGRHWDGVDRSTGYEKDLFKRQNDRQATEREAYLWSVSDM